MKYDSHSEIIAQWGKTAIFADEMNVPLERAKGWRKRNSIPADYWSRCIECAELRGIEGVTWETLSGIKERERFREEVAA